MNMNRLVTVVALVGLAVGSGAALAGEDTPASSMTKRQAMKDCIEQQKTGNISMSKSQMKQFCKQKLKDQKATGELPQPPATDVPKN